MKVKNLPQKWDLYKYTGLPHFNEWPAGAEISALYKKMDRKAKITGRWALPTSVLTWFIGSIFMLKAFFWDLLIVGSGTFPFNVGIGILLVIIGWGIRSVYLSARR